MLSESFYEPSLEFIQSKSRASTTYQLPKKTITEKEVIVQILYILLGMQGSILSKKSNSQQIQLSDRFQMSHLTSQTFKSAIKQSLKICNQTKYVQSECKKLYLSTKNGVVKSFCEAVFDYLQMTKKYFSSILSEVNNIIEPINSKITMLNIQNTISERSYMLGFLIRCLNTCAIEQEKKVQVVRLLDKMWEIEQEILPYPQFNKAQLIKIFKKTLKMYFQNIKDWLLMKPISHSMDYFIKLEQNSKKNLSQYFLHRSQQLEVEKIPKILENQSKGILEIGKTIRFISLYYEDFERQKLMNYLNIDQEFVILDQNIKVQPTISFTRVKNQKITLNQRLKKKKSEKKQELPDENPYEMFSKINNSFNINWIQKRETNKSENKQFIQAQNREIKDYGFLFYTKCLLIQILENVNKKCLTFFKNDEDTIIRSQKNRIQTSLISTLIGIKKFMLLQQGDFVEQFFTAAEQILEKQKAQVSHNRVYSCIEEAVESSSAKHIQKEILNNLHFDFIKQIDNKRSEKLKLWVLFCFNYRQDNPINYIFNRQMMEKLKDICNFIFKIKKSQLVLTKLWNLDRELIKSDKSRAKVIKKGKVLRNSLNNFLNSCASFVLNKIDVIWHEYKQKIIHVTTVFDIVSQSVEVISNLQKNSTQNNLFYNGVMMCLSVIQKFRKLHELILDPNMIIPIRQIDQLEFQMRTVAQIVMKIPELNQIINYNSFFDKLE